MKKTLSLVIVLCVSLLLIGCKNKMKINVNEKAQISGINDAPLDYDEMRDVFSKRAYLFSEYEELASFFEANEIDFVGETKERYSEEYFKEKAIIIYYFMYGHPGYKHEYELIIKEDTLFLTIIAYDKKKGNYAGMLCAGFKIIEFYKSDIESTNKFEFEIKIESR